MTFYRDAAGLVDAVHPAAGFAVCSVALIGVTAALEMARAFAVVEKYVSAVVFCCGHGIPALRNPRR